MGIKLTPVERRIALRRREHDDLLVKLRSHLARTTKMVQAAHGYARELQVLAYNPKTGAFADHLGRSVEELKKQAELLAALLKSEDA